MFKIIYSKSARKYLLKMPSKLQKRVLEKVCLLAKDPYISNNNIRKLVGREAYRLRIGDFRVIYSINDEILVIDVIDIGPRGGIYQ